MKRRLFCELGPAAFWISSVKCRTARRVTDACRKAEFARERRGEPLPVLVYRHNSLICRRLGQVDMTLQENKSVNLALAAPRVDGILIHPGETFSFWQAVGNPSARLGYREGLTVGNGVTGRGELRADLPQAVKYHIRTEDERFVEEDGIVYRLGQVWREGVDPATGAVVLRELLRENHAKVLYDTEGLNIVRK